MLRGSVFQIWQLDKMPDPETLKKFVQHYQIGALSIKLLDGPNPYNRIGGNDKKVIQYVETLSSVCKVGMWQFCYGEYPNREGEAVGVTFEKLEKYGLSFHQIDAEGNYWMKWGANRRAETYMNTLNIPKRIEVYLNSYRYPKYFPAFPWKKFLTHERLTGNSPQVYWEFAHNPVEQLDRSRDEYREIELANGVDVPFLPFAPTYFRGVPGADNGWGPTPEELMEFVTACKMNGYPAWGFYSLDKILQHYDTYGWKWMQAITGKGKISEEPLPNPDTGNQGYRVAETTLTGLWVHKTPDVLSSSRLFQLARGIRPYVKETLFVDGRSWARIGDNMYACMKDKNGTQYLKWV